MSSVPEMTILLHDREFESKDLIPRASRIRVLHQLVLEKILATENLFVLTSMTALPEVMPVVQAASQQEHFRALFVRSNIDPIYTPQMFERAKLYMFRSVLVHSDSDVPRRVLAAWQIDAQEQLIANAFVAKDCLFITDCTPRTWEVPFDILPALKVIPVEERPKFEIDEDGSYIYWKASDTHLDMEALRSAVDAEWQEKALVDKALRERRFGEAVAVVRKAHNLQQASIPGISERHMRRIEKGFHPKVETLKKLSQAHEMSLNEYLEEVAQTISKMQNSQSKSTKVITQLNTSKNLSSIRGEKSLTELRSILETDDLPVEKKAETTAG